MCHDKFISLANAVNDLQLGILIKSIEEILLLLVTLIPLGASTSGSLMYAEVGLPSCKVAISDSLLLNLTLIDVPLVSTVASFVQLEKSIKPITDVHPFNDNVYKLGIVGNTPELVILSICTFTQSVRSMADIFFK